MPYATVSISTGSTTTSTPVALNWRQSKPVGISVTASSSFACDLQIFYTMDDLQLIGGSSLAKWVAVSSAVGQPGTHFLSSSAYPDGVQYTFTNPIAAVRLGSTAQTAMGVGNTLTMRVMQGEIA
jgi:hypothetical protein